MLYPDAILGYHSGIASLEFEMNDFLEHYLHLPSARHCIGEVIHEVFMPPDGVTFMYYQHFLY